MNLVALNPSISCVPFVNSSVVVIRSSRSMPLLSFFMIFASCASLVGKCFYLPALKCMTVVVTTGSVP